VTAVFASEATVTDRLGAAKAKNSVSLWQAMYCPINLEKYNRRFIAE
jgi:hypothetical protein